MWFRIDARSPTPIYQQIVDGIKEAVAKNVLQGGERLPSVRELAGLMTLNHNTVAKAYQELERERVIEVVRGRGTFVAEPGSTPDRAERVAHMKDIMKQLWVEAHHLQMTSQDLMTLMKSAVHEWDQERGREQS